MRPRPHGRATPAQPDACLGVWRPAAPTGPHGAAPAHPTAAPREAGAQEDVRPVAPVKGRIVGRASSGPQKESPETRGRRLGAGARVLCVSAGGLTAAARPQPPISGPAPKGAAVRVTPKVGPGGGTAGAKGWTARGKMGAAAGRAKGKTYNSGYSHVVTHRTTSPPVRSLSSGERTGSSVLCDLWSYVPVTRRREFIYRRSGSGSRPAPVLNPPLDRTRGRRPLPPSAHSTRKPSLWRRSVVGGGGRRWAAVGGAWAGTEGAGQRWGVVGGPSLGRRATVGCGGGLVRGRRRPVGCGGGGSRWA